MKKIFLLQLVVTSFTFCANAQSPVVKELRELIQSAKTNFKSDIRDKIEEDTANRLAYYKTKAADYSIVSYLIIQDTNNSNNTYTISYNVKDADVNTIVLINSIVDQYIGELNAMVKSGNYTGRDYTEGDMSITEIKDIAGKHILDYLSNKDVQRIVIFSVK